MKYCFNCNHITAGEPLFCNRCGASYDVKLCSRLHVNPRWAEVCSQCGSRELSTPQPKVPFWAKALLRVTPPVFAILFGMTALLLVLDLLQQLANRPDLLFALIVLIALLWWLWSEIPDFIRQFIYRSMKRRDTHEKH